MQKVLPDIIATDSINAAGKQQLKFSLGLFQWRKWPMELLFFPLTLYVLFIGSLRSRRLFYFSAANPKVSLGGFAGDSKSQILESVPLPFHLRMLPVHASEHPDAVLAKIHAGGLTFPLYAKPDLGEAGFLVRRLNTEQDWQHYHQSINVPYLVQEPAEGKLELAVLVHHADGMLQVSSVTERKALKVTGDGQSTLRELLKRQGEGNNRKLMQSFTVHPEAVPVAGERLEPGPAGNLFYGTEMIHRQDLETTDCRAIFENLNATVGLFNYGRYDIRCVDEDHFRRGDFKVLEINGVKGEPLHMYDKRYDLAFAYREIFRHWEIILKISRREIAGGARCPGILEGAKILRRHVFAKKHALKNR